MSLESVDVRVRTASTCQALRSELERRAPDLLICDIQLPDGNGLELISELRARPEYGRLPIIVLSGALSLSENHMEVFRKGPSLVLTEQGTTLFLNKLVPMADVQDAVRLLLSTA